MRSFKCEVSGSNTAGRSKVSAVRSQPSPKRLFTLGSTKRQKVVEKETEKRRESITVTK